MDALPSSEVIAWADGFLLVYSITDRQSFNWVKRVRLHIAERKGRGLNAATTLTPTPQLPSGVGGDVSPTNMGPPVVLLGNKADMVHLRQVSTEEGWSLCCLWMHVCARAQK